MTAAATQANDATELDFDPAALRRKYDLERDKRLRVEGNDQYVETKDDYAHFQDDPWADPNFTRAPIAREVQVVVVGGGFGGLLSGARLREQGFEDICIIEKAGDFGGTWYWNRYPGAACDTESYIYLPLLEETGYMPVSKYARAPEIAEHSRRIGKHFDLYKSALFQTVITGMRWQEESQRWEVRTNRKDVLTA
ncbi:MAG: NAD(P)-binding protein, partial [Burkholderiaceae bacterium]